MAATGPSSREILFEFRRVGNSVKVSAIDTATNTEVSIVGSATAPSQKARSAGLRVMAASSSSPGLSYNFV